MDQPFTMKISKDGVVVFEHTFLEAPVIIGRSSSCSVPLVGYHWVSRKHFEVFMEEDGHWYAQDLQSANGITYNGRLLSRVQLHPGMMIEIGPLQFEFHFNTVTETFDTNHFQEGESPYPALDKKMGLV